MKSIRPTRDFWSFCHIMLIVHPEYLKHCCGWYLWGIWLSKSNQWVTWCGIGTAILSSWSMYFPNCVALPVLFLSSYSESALFTLSLTRHRWGIYSDDDPYRIVCNLCCNRLRVCNCRRSLIVILFCNSCMVLIVYVLDWRTSIFNLTISTMPLLLYRVGYLLHVARFILVAAGLRGRVCRWRKD